MANANSELPFFQPGEPLSKQLTANRLNGIIRYIRSITPLQSVGINIKRLPNGLVLDVPRQRGGGSGLHPYQGLDASVTTTAKVMIQYGTHNGVIPTIDGNPMEVDITQNVLTLGGSDTLVYIQCDLDVDFAITSASIHSGTSLPTSDDTTAYQTLFAVDIATDGSGNKSVTIADNVLGSQAYQYCGGSHLFGLV